MTDTETPSLDEQLKVADLRIKKLDAIAKSRSLPSGGIFSALTGSPMLSILLTASLGIVSAVVSNYMQSQATLNLEREKLTSSLIIKAIETGDRKISATNLKFLVDMNLINDVDGIIQSYSIDPSSAPVLSTAGSPIIPADTNTARAIIDKYEKEFGPLAESSRINLVNILDYMSNDSKINDIRIAAYALASIKFETSNTFQPLAEHGSDDYLKRIYGPATSLGKRFGHLSDEDALRFRGRGYIQITGRANYDRIGKIIGVDLVNNPDFALQPDVAYKIYVFSLVDGYLTGKKISDFINETETDYVNARRVINGGLMNAPLIADTATRIERILKASLSNPAANGPS
jgi:hypothetical protein